VGPGTVFLENVANHLRVGFKQVHDELQAMGYRVAAGVFTAREVGASHLRQRLFILAHAPGGGCGQTIRRQSQEPQPSVPGQMLANRHGKGQQGGRLTSGVGTPLPTSRGRALADPGNGPIPLPGRLTQDGNGAGSTGQGILLFPPGPEDHESWAAIIEKWPALEPAVRGVAHGTASRVDRLRATGNAVVPLVAAHALCTLSAALLQTESLT
jgi:DNA (cytosine-5)-methyltransferase 1